MRACWTVDRSVKTLKAADAYLTRQIFGLLYRDKFVEAAHLLWSTETFDPRPMACRRIMHALSTHNRVIVLGASASSKSYSCIVWIFLRWLQDVAGTGARIISSSAEHALVNTFSHLTRLHQNAIIPLPGQILSGYIGLSREDRHCSLQVVAMSLGQTRNVLQGSCHPVPRKHPHPRFGRLTRMMILVDEIEMVNESQLWDALDNVLSTEHDRRVTVCATSNPRDVTSRLAAEAEPPRGWHTIDPMEDDEWTSKRNYRVLRINALKSENVRSGQEIFPGMMTRTGMLHYASKTGGNDAEYTTFVLGMYPLEGGVSDALIPYSHVANMWGEFVFEPGTAYDCMSIDPAHEGDDLCICCVGRYGLARALRKPDSNQTLLLVERRMALQIYQFHAIPKGMVKETYTKIKALAVRYGIAARNVAIDKTGNGYGLYCEFVEAGWDVLGVSWGSGASRMKVLDIHKHSADALYDGCSSEQYHAFAAWLQADLIRVLTSCETDRFIKGLTGRKLRPGRRVSSVSNETLRRLEEKADFKSRMSWSPDHADSAVQLLHLVRMRIEPAAKTAGRKVPVLRLMRDSDMQNIKTIDFSDEK